MKNLEPCPNIYQRIAEKIRKGETSLLPDERDALIDKIIDHCSARLVYSNDEAIMQEAIDAGLI